MFLKTYLKDFRKMFYSQVKGFGVYQTKRRKNTSYRHYRGSAPENMIMKLPLEKTNLNILCDTCL